MFSTIPTLNLPFDHKVLARIGEFALVEKSGEFVTYGVSSSGDCYWGHYMPKDETNGEEAMKAFLIRARVIEEEEAA